jgi:hypothetical protein
MADVKQPVSSQPQVCAYPVFIWTGASYFCAFRRALLRCKQAETRTPKIVRLVLMGSEIGVSAYLTASAGVASVRRTEPNLRTHLFVFVNLTVGCWSVWCPCVVYSKNRQRLRSLQTQGTPLADGGETYDSHCFIYGGLDITGYSWIMQVCSGGRTFHKVDIT